MDILPDFNSFSWCKKWSIPKLSEKEKELLNQCKDLERIKYSYDVEEIIQKSSAFPTKFPINTVRLQELQDRIPIERLERNIVLTYPLIHERVLLLMAQFLIYKREHGSDIEKSLYEHMTIHQLVDRILKKRAISFVGPRDKYRLISGESGVEGWEQVGTPEEKPPLVLENCLSYDEMKLSAMVYVSGYTECINDGTRQNKGVVIEENVEKEAVIIGLIGPRFSRRNKMDYEDILITKEQNLPENGYGEGSKSFFSMMKKDKNVENLTAKKAYRDMWANFYETKPLTFIQISANPNIKSEVKKENRRYKRVKKEDGNTSTKSYKNVSQVKTKYDTEYTERYIHVTKGKSRSIFDNEVYYKRLCIIAETTFIEAEYRAKKSETCAFINIIGCGLGVWMISGHQCDVYVLTFLERIKHFLENGLIDHVSDVNFAYIKCSANVEALFSNPKHQNKAFPNRQRLFLESPNHSKGGINIYLENRQPSTKLTGEDKGKLLVLTYPWDSNAHPGNEFWYGSLHTSGDPAAACSTQISELHNAHINDSVTGANAQIAANEIITLQTYCKEK